MKLLRAPCCHCSVPEPRAWLKEGAPSQGCGSLARQGLSWPPWMIGCQAEERLPPASQPAHLAARPQGQACIPGVVPGCPEAAALLRLLGPGEVGASVMTDDLLCEGRGGVTPRSTLGAACAPCPQHPSTWSNQPISEGRSGWLFLLFMPYIQAFVFPSSWYLFIEGFIHQ